VKWIVGLGNPGKRYENTRHNVGFLVVDRFAGRHGIGSFRSQFSASVASMPLAGGEKVYLVKPQTYMNLSGSAVREVLEFFGGSPDDLLVVHDDLDLPLGRLRYRAGGSSGGHLGVESAIASLGTQAFARMKVGIGREAGQDAADFVLAPLGDPERSVLDRAVDRAAESLDVWIADGVGRAASLYNGPEREPGREAGTNGRTAEGD
jgi:PTH1 family peptidyl-tRNA hydrolase